MYQIGEVAQQAKVTIRLLHHYDEIGLLVPSGRSEAGYRLYARTDVERLQQILFYRALEFPLEQIQRLMNDPGFDRHTALLQQRELLTRRAQDLSALLDLINLSLIDAELPEEQRTMSTKAMLEVFPEMKEEYQHEAEQRWGSTDAWKQSAKRHDSYTKADWKLMKAEMQQVQEQLETVFNAGKAPASPEAIAAVEASRLLIDRWHYTCSKEFHVTLTAGTSSDERFVRNIDKNCPGLAVFIHEAAKANFVASK